ncbi:unnamed protein product [Malus baccata var. baccata]
MSGPSDRRFDLNLGERAVPPSPDNIWRPSFISLTGPLTVGDSVMKNDMTAAVVAQNLVTHKDNRLLSKRPSAPFSAAQNLSLLLSSAKPITIHWLLKQLSGNMKRKKKAKDNEIAESLRGSLHKFFSTKNESVENLRENNVGEESQNIVGESHDHENSSDLEENVGDESQDHENGGDVNLNVDGDHIGDRPCELAVKDYLALSVQCAGSVSNMVQRLFARTRRVESLATEVMSLKQEIRGLKHENKQLHMLAHNYTTNMKMKIDQLQESYGQILLDHQRFVSLFQQHLPSSSGAVPRNEALNDQSPAPLLPGVLPSDEAPSDQ